MIPIITIEDNDYIYYENGEIFHKKLGRNLKISTGSHGYKRVRLNRKLYSLHRILYEKFIGVIPNDKVVDHINNKKDDNRLENLQLLSQRDNSRKQLKQTNNTSGYNGINKHGNRWRVSINDNDNKKISKTFVTMFSALIWRKYMEIVVLKYPQHFKKGYKKL
jgi:hypothetical protein